MLTPTRRRRPETYYRFGMIRARKALRSLALTLSEEDRGRVQAEIYDAGQLSPAYMLLLACACGIAALGLLQSSTAVVIGAMLISPLMGPIVALGLSLARFDPPAARTAATTLGLGALAAILASALIVWLSPLKDVTPEILARTRPTLLDLAVAVLSGVVGAYVTITRRGAVIAGVAIATALMPPLAVVGYGVATASAAIAGGAMLLFLTNVVAILGAVYGVAWLYGFRHVATDAPQWQAPVLLAAIIALCVPLAVSLQNIVIEARETSRARSEIEKTFEGADPRVTDLVVSVERRRLQRVQAIVFTHDYVSQAEAKVRQGLGGKVSVDIEQVLAADEEAQAQAAARSALINRALVATQQPVQRTAESRLRDMLSGAGEVVQVQRRDGRLEAIVVLGDKATLGDYRALEVSAQRLMPGAEVRILPPFLKLPVIHFARGSRALSDTARRDIAVAAWALKRWRMPAVQIVGAASPGRRGPRPIDLALARGRAEAVAALLTELGGPPAEVSATVPETPGEETPDMWVVTLRATASPAAVAAAAAPAAAPGETSAPARGQAP